ncbi:hypothetical protein Tco_0739692 [Tanacetum coccineum]
MDGGGNQLCLEEPFGGYLFLCRRTSLGWLRRIRYVNMSLGILVFAPIGEGFGNWVESVWIWNSSEWPRQISARRKLYSGNMPRECIKFLTLAMIMAEEDTHYAHGGFSNVGLIYLSARRKNALSMKIKRIKDVVVKCWLECVGLGAEIGGFEAEMGDFRGWISVLKWGLTWVRLVAEMF